MKTQIKTILKSGLISGIVYAGLMAWYDYSDGQEFRIWKFVFHASFFAIFMGLVSISYQKDMSKKENRNG